MAGAHAQGAFAYQPAMMPMQMPQQQPQAPGYDQMGTCSLSPALVHNISSLFDTMKTAINDIQ